MKLTFVAVEKFKVDGENVKPVADGVTETAPELDAVMISAAEVLPCVREGYVGGLIVPRTVIDEFAGVV